MAATLRASSVNKREIRTEHLTVCELFRKPGAVPFRVALEQRALPPVGTGKLGEMIFAPGTSIVGAVLGFCGVMLWRLREGRRPVTPKAIVIPPAGMSTGFCMFFAPPFRVHPLWALEAFLVGALVLSYPLIRTSRLVLEGDTVMVRRSKVFFGVVIFLAAIRYFARGYIGKYISVEQTAGLFFILAFGMIVAWRTSMYFEYKRVIAGRA